MLKARRIAEKMTKKPKWLFFGKGKFWMQNRVRFIYIFDHIQTFWGNISILAPIYSTTIGYVRLSGCFFVCTSFATDTFLNSKLFGEFSFKFTFIECSCFFMGEDAFEIVRTRHPQREHKQSARKHKKPIKSVLLFHFR